MAATTVLHGAVLHERRHQVGSMAESAEGRDGSSSPSRRDGAEEEADGSTLEAHAAQEKA